jgi:hypothetical protein
MRMGLLSFEVPGCRDTLVFGGPTGAAANAGPVAGDSFGLGMDKESQTEGLINV